MRLNYLFLLLVFCAMACGKEDVDADNIETIENYLAANGLTAERTASDLFYVTIEEGSEEKPNITSEVTVAYKGYLPTGEVFDMSGDSGITFNLGGVILGWQEGIQLFGTGGEGILLIPSKLGYGARPPFGSGIPENSVLIFDVKVLDFE